MRDESSVAVSHLPIPLVTHLDHHRPTAPPSFSSGGHPTPELSLRRALSEESQEVLGRLLQTPQKQGLFLSLHLHFLSPFFTSWLSDSLLPTWVFVFALFCSSSSRIGITWKKTGVITFLMILVAQMEIRRSF